MSDSTLSPPPPKLTSKQLERLYCLIITLLRDLEPTQPSENHEYSSNESS